MKKRKIFRLLGIMIAVSVIMAGCGGDGSSSRSYETAATVDSFDYGTNDSYSYSESEIEDASADTSSFTDGEKNIESNKKLIKTVDIALETKDFETTIQKVDEITKNVHGYIENSTVYGKNEYSYNSSRSANYTIRIPADQIDSYVDATEQLGNVTRKTESVEDVSLKYIDVESHKAALKTEYDRLLELVAKAESPEAIITIESQLANIRYEMQNYESQLRYYDNQVDYATISISINETEELTKAPEKGVFGRMKEGFSNSMKSIKSGCVEWMIMTVSALPYTILFAAGVCIIVLGLRKFGAFDKICKNKKKK